MTHFLTGITDEILQVKRGQLLETTKADLERVTEKYLLSAHTESRTSKVIFGSLSEEVKRDLLGNGWVLEDFNKTSLKRDDYDDTDDIETW